MRLALPPPRRSRIPLTSLVDVVFILLFFFMLAAQPMTWRALTLNLSLAPAAATQAPSIEASLTVVMLADGALYLGGTLISREALLARIASAPTDQRLRIVPGRALQMQQLVDLLDFLKPTGVAMQLVNPRPAP